MGGSSGSAKRATSNSRKRMTPAEAEQIRSAFMSQIKASARARQSSNISTAGIGLALRGSGGNPPTNPNLDYVRREEHADNVLNLMAKNLDNPFSFQRLADAMFYGSPFYRDLSPAIKSALPPPLTVAPAIPSDLIALERQRQLALENRPRVRRQSRKKSSTR